MKKLTLKQIVKDVVEENFNNCAFSSGDIIDVLPGEGKTTIRTAISNLRKSGFLLKAGPDLRSGYKLYSAGDVEPLTELDRKKPARRIAKPKPKALPKDPINTFVSDKVKRESLVGRLTGVKVNTVFTLEYLSQYGMSTFQINQLIRSGHIRYDGRGTIKIINMIGPDCAIDALKSMAEDGGLEIAIANPSLAQELKSVY